MIRLSARRVTALRARASPAQPIQGGGFGGGAKPPAEVLTNRRTHASKTRERSEDLGWLVGEMADDDVGVAHRPERSETLGDLVHRTRNERLPTEPAVSAGERSFERSEEHTSELQSPCNLVCRLLLEKKKKTQMHNLPLA